MKRSLDNVKKGCSSVEEEEVKVKVTARLYVSVSTLVILFFVRIRRRNSAGVQGCLLYLALDAG
jgi:hypothetical protein